MTWALGTGVATSTARSGVRPTTVTGGRESFDRAWSTAPIERSGSMIRATGRRRNESSPSRTLRNGSPARIPANSRRLVPELPQSRSAAGLAQPVDARRDDPVVDVAGLVVDRRSTRRRPSAAQTRGGRADVGAVAGAADPALARGQRREHQRPMADRLVAGQPRARRAGGRPDGRRRRRRLDDGGRCRPPSAAFRAGSRPMPSARAARRTGSPWSERTCSWTGTSAAISVAELVEGQLLLGVRQRLVRVADGPRP